MTPVSPKVRDLMSTEPRYVDLTHPPSRALKLLCEGPLGHLPVLDGERLVGVISRIDLERTSLKAWVADGQVDGVRLDSQHCIADLMTSNPTYVREAEPLKYAAELLSNGRFHCLPVLDERDHLTGILTTSDLAKWISRPPLQTRNSLQTRDTLETRNTRPSLGTVDAWMTPDPQHYAPDTLVDTVRANPGFFRHVPIFDESLKGFVHHSALQGIDGNTRLQQLELQRALTVPPDMPTLRAIARLRAAGEDVLWVCEDGNPKLLGVFTEHDACRVALQNLPSRGLQVHQLASTGVDTVNGTDSVELATATMLRRWIRHLPVMQNDRLLGVLSWRDLAAHSPETSVGSLVSPVTHQTTWDTPLESAAQQMVDHHIGALPVLDDQQRLEGILTRVDIIRALLEPLHDHPTA